MNWSVISARLRAGGWLTAVLLLLAVLGLMFHGVFLPGQTMFSNDGPLGQLMAQCHRLPGRFTGCWLDLNSVGFDGGAATPGISFGLQWLLGPVLFSKFYAIISLLILGLGAWCFFRQLRLDPAACILGALAAMLNSTFFSVACWGVGAHDITAGMTFFALAALADTTSPQRWLRVGLAGLALGMAVTEGADVGAIFSLYAAAFVLYQMWVVEGPAVRNLATGLGRLTLVVLCAGFLAAQAVHGLIGTSISGVAGMQQDSQTKQQRWDWATQWSLPKVEALNLIVPGLFGYRMDTAQGGVYWGTIGRDPAWSTYEENGRQGPPPTGFLRYNGGGNYAGELVVLVALWAVLESLRRKNTICTSGQRKWLWFWLGASVISLLLAFGRYAPFYKLVYALPYFSTIRNPTKFLYLFSLGLVVLFAYGIDALFRRYIHVTRPEAASRRTVAGQSWWNKASRFEKNWVYGCAATGLTGLLAWWDYAANRDRLVQYLGGAQIGQSPELVANFSIHEAGWSVMVFFLVAGLLVLILSGTFAGRRTVWGGICLAIILVADLGVANRPWITFWNYQDKYASNPLIDLLRDKPYNHRVAGGPRSTSPQLAILSQVYSLEWMEQLFPYYDIQSFETVEMSRVAQDFSEYTAAINDTTVTGPWFHLARAWQLAATRYVLAPADFADVLRQQPYTAPLPLQMVTRFNLVAKPGIINARRPDQVTAVIAPDGPFALFDSTAALPRAKLFSRWQVNTNDADVLAKMFDPAFDPAQSVFVAGGVPVCGGGETNESSGSVDITSYAPKDIVLAANASSPCVLLLNDHFEKNWKVLVDGHPQSLLRCNFLMRGVYLENGAHRVEFKFEPGAGWLYVSLAAVAVAVFLLGTLLVWTRKTSPVMTAAVVTKPVSVVPKKADRKLGKAGTGGGKTARR